MAYWHYVLITGLGSTVVTLVAMHLALVPWRRSAGAHWTERARRLWPARRAIIGIVVSCMVCADMVPRVLDWEWEGPAAYWPAIVGTLAGSYFSAREIEPRYSWTGWLRDTFWKLVVQFGLIALFVWQVWAMPVHPGLQDWLRFAIGVAGVILIATGLWLPVLARLMPPRSSPDRRLERLVDEVSRETGIVPRRLYFADSPVANAAALTFLHSVVVTSRALEVLDDEELRGIIRHELAHLKESRAVQLTRLVPAVGFMCLAWGNPVYHRFGNAGWFAMIALFLVALRASRHVARRMEDRADITAIQGATDGAPYARALEKLYIANQVPAVLRGKSTIHPHLYDRMLAAGVTPDYPRPAPPSFMAWPGWVVLLFPLVLMAALAAFPLLR